MSRWISLASLPVLALGSTFSCSGGKSTAMELDETALVIDLRTAVVRESRVSRSRDRENRWRSHDLLLRPLSRGIDGATTWIGVFEVTRGQWSAAGSSDHPWADSRPADLFHGPSSASLPASGMSAARIEGWLADINARLPADILCRLPTADEWREACLAGAPGPYAWGSLPLAASAARQAVVRETATACMPVGSLEANGAGLYDMHGNVMEWTISEPSGHELRGGSWYHHLIMAAADQPIPFDPDIDYGFSGFRVVVEVSATF